MSTAIARCPNQPPGPGEEEEPEPPSLLPQVERFDHLILPKLSSPALEEDPARLHHIPPIKSRSHRSGPWRCADPSRPSSVRSRGPATSSNPSTRLSSWAAGPSFPCPAGTGGWTSGITAGMGSSPSARVGATLVTENREQFEMWKTALARSRRALDLYILERR